LLTELTARDFRNQADLRWRPGGGIQLLLGDNGAGKTSLLEAIYVLATTRSFRTAQLGDCCQHGSDGFWIVGEAETGQRQRLEVGWDREGLTRSINGKPTALSEHLAALPVVAWTSNDTELLSGGPQARRRFMDRGLVGLRPTALSALARYRQAIGQKRQLLLARAGGLEAWNEVLAAAAAELIELRCDYVERLARSLGRVLERYELDLPNVALVYRPSPPQGTAGSEGVLEELRRQAAAERQRGQPLVGPHRDELEIRWDGRAARRVVSAGERKALGLALLAAQGRLLSEGGKRPVYLLDDMDAELATGTLRRVLTAFSGASQAVVTSNRPAAWEGVGVEQRWWLEGASPRAGQGQGNGQGFLA
jgi:DNA replication and repair protein RecF